MNSETLGRVKLGNVALNFTVSVSKPSASVNVSRGPNCCLRSEVEPRDGRLKYGADISQPIYHYRRYIKSLNIWDQPEPRRDP